MAAIAIRFWRACGPGRAGRLGYMRIGIFLVTVGISLLCEEVRRAKTPQTSGTSSPFNPNQRREP